MYSQNLEKHQRNSMSRFREEIKSNVALLEVLYTSDTQPNIILLTHDSCGDGNACEWVLRRHAEVHSYDFTTVYRQYNRPLDIDVEDAIVIIADYSYDLDTMGHIIDMAKLVIMVDHHESSLPVMEKYPNYAYSTTDKLCGAELLWELLFPNVTIPYSLKYVGDRDTWRWEQKDSRIICDYLDSYKKNREKYFELLSLPATVFYDTCLTAGKVVNEMREQTITTVATSRHIPMRNWGKYVVPFINTTTLISEIGNRVSEQYPFVVMYFFTDKELVLSFRASDPEINLPDLGVPRGHKHAAGRGIALSEVNLDEFFKADDIGLFLSVLFDVELNPLVFDEVFYSWYEATGALDKMTTNKLFETAWWKTNSEVIVGDYIIVGSTPYNGEDLADPLWLTTAFSQTSGLPASSFGCVTEKINDDIGVTVTDTGVPFPRGESSVCVHIDTFAFYRDDTSPVQVTDNPDVNAALKQ